MRNAADEFRAELQDAPAQIKCAVITHDQGYSEDEVYTAVLPVDFTQKDYDAFIEKLKVINYDAGYGSAELHGLILFEDGSWCERGEYDGSEWWEYKTTPPVPQECIKPAPGTEGRNPEVTMYLVGYDRKFKEATNSGWGCGYLMIPMNHPIIEGELSSGPYEYLQVPGFSEEITWTERKELNGKHYMVIGFDTAHSWNNPEEHNYDFCFAKTMEMKDIVDNYKIK